MVDHECEDVESQSAWAAVVDAIRELEKDSDLRRDRLQCVGGTFKIDAEHNERGVERRW